VQRLARVLFEMDPGDADAPRTIAVVRSTCPPVASGWSYLRDLIALRQVGIEVVLAREDRRLVDRGAEREPARIAKSTARRLRTGSAPGRPRHTGQTCVLGGRAERSAAAAKDLRVRQELGVNLEADLTVSKSGIRSGREHFRRDAALEVLEILREHRRELAGLRVVRRRIRPRSCAGHENLRWHAGAFRSGRRD